MKLLNLKWRFSKKLLVFLTFFALFIPLSGILWIFTEFNIPFAHSGDKIIFRLMLFLWWLSCTILIFGWRIENEK